MNNIFKQGEIVWPLPGDTHVNKETMRQESKESEQYKRPSFEILHLQQPLGTPETNKACNQVSLSQITRLK
jgi:hypothetical protein